MKAEKNKTNTKYEEKKNQQYLSDTKVPLIQITDLILMQ